MKCMNSLSGACQNEVYTANGKHWAYCLECLRKDYDPGEDDYYRTRWKSVMEERYMKLLKEHNLLKRHHQKVMRRYSIRIQRYKKWLNNLADRFVIATDRE